MVHNDVHNDILELLKDLSNTDNDPTKELFDSIDIRKLKSIFFMNYRSNGKREAGLRLTNQGKTIMEGFFECWEIPIDNEFDIGNREIMILDRHCKLPYYIQYKPRMSQPRMLILFDKELALILKLNSGNIRMIADMELDHVNS